MAGESWRPKFRGAPAEPEPAPVVDLQPRPGGKLCDGFVRILRLRPGERAAAILLGDLSGVWLHYSRDDGSLPHYAEKCPRCPGRTRRRWYGAAVALDGRCAPDDHGVRHWERRLVEFTDQNVDQLADVETLRGVAVDLSRDRAATSPLAVALSDRTVLAEKLPEPWKVWPVLVATWGLPDLRAELDAEREDGCRWKQFRIVGAA